MINNHLDLEARLEPSSLQNWRGGRRCPGIGSGRSGTAIESRRSFRETCRSSSAACVNELWLKCRIVLEHEPEIMACAYICFHELFSNHCNLYKHLFNSFENQILSLIFFKFVFDNMYVCIRVWKKGKEKNSKTRTVFPAEKSNDFLAKMVLCFINFSDLLREKNVWDLRLRILQFFEVTWKIYSNNERSEQFSKQNVFLTYSWRFLTIKKK